MNSGLKALLIEAGVILILLVVVFAALNFFGIFKFSSILPAPNIFQTNNVAQNNGQNQTNSNSNPSTGQEFDTSSIDFSSIDAQINTFSRIDGYQLTVSDGDELIDILTSWGIFNANHTGFFYASGSTEGTPLKIINVYLTTVQQPVLLSALPTGEIFSSAHIKIEKGTFNVYVQLTPAFLNDPEVQERIDGFFQNKVLTILFKNNNLIQGADSSIAEDTYDDREEELQAALAPINERNLQFFRVIKQ